MLKKGLCYGGLRRDLEPREAFERARTAGFDGIELGLSAEGRVSLPAPYDEPDRAAELARSVGLELPSTMGPGFNDLFARAMQRRLLEIPGPNDPEPGVCTVCVNGGQHARGPGHVTHHPG